MITPVIATAAKPLHTQQQTDTDKTKARNLWSTWIPMEPTLFSRANLMRLCVMQKVDEMLSAAGVSYWITGGTLIGALRHQGFIPHDDDIDIECFATDFEKLEALPTQGDFFVGFESGGRWEGHRMGKLKFCRGFFFVDVFERSLNEKGELNMYKEFPGQSEVFPLERYTFHNIEVSGPNKATCGSYLARLYGSDWSTSVCVWNHDYNWYHMGGFDPRKTVLSLEAYNEVVRHADLGKLRAESTADATFQTFFQGEDSDEEAFFTQLSRENFERTKRRNRQAAEWRAIKKEREGRNEVN